MDEIPEKRAGIYVERSLVLEQWPWRIDSDEDS